MTSRPVDTLVSARFEPDPRSVGAARALVRDLLVDTPLRAVEDEAVLLVSEVVTNAVLHARTPVELTCRIAGSTLLVEVTDRSPVRPSARPLELAVPTATQPVADPTADVAPTGRGLGLVEVLASDWGVRATAEGKTVWFRLSLADAQPGDPPADQSPSPPDAGFTLRLRDAPAALLATAVLYAEGLLRELALTAIAEGPERWDGGWPHAHLDVGPILAAVRKAAGPTGGRGDVDVHLPSGSGRAASARMSLVAEAVAMAHQGRLLATPELPEVAACRRWLLGQIAAQEAGDPPTPWQLPPVLPAAPVAPLQLPADMLADLDRSAAVVADEANRIVHVTPAAGAMLGWAPDELVGRRLVDLVPPALREAHLAGFGRYLVTRRPRLLGRHVVLPVLRADGTEVPVPLVITEHRVTDGATAFVARLASS